MATREFTSSTNIDEYLNLPLTNRHANHGVGGVNPVLPTDLSTLKNFVSQARSSDAAPSNFAALLFQYRLVSATTAAGIDLSAWDPRAGVHANRDTIIKLYQFFADLQLNHRELQSAGMSSLGGADFAGGLIDFDVASRVYGFPCLQSVVSAIVKLTVAAFNKVASPTLKASIPDDLRALAKSMCTITAADLRDVVEEVLVMQKNVFSDLALMHQAYVTEGLTAIEEMEQAGLFGGETTNAWRDISSGDPARIASGNRALLRREQFEVNGRQWDDLRNFRGDIGRAIAYLVTVTAVPSVAGVIFPRSFEPITANITLGRRRIALTMPLPSWNWSIDHQRWAWMSSQLLPRYAHLVETDWPQIETELQIPFEDRLETHRPLLAVLRPFTFRTVRRAPAQALASLRGRLPC